MYFGLDERWLASLARDRVGPDDVIYDVGAHVGYTALLFAKHARHVHAFELVPSVAQEFLTRTIQANALSNVTVHQVGLFDEDRIVELPVSQTMMASLYFIRNGSHQERCHLVSLDAYAAEQGLPVPSLIKIDVEGAEIHCLRGSLALIKRHRPVLIVEFHSWDLFDEGAALLASLGYRVIGRSDARIAAQPADRPAKFHESVLCLPRDTNLATWM